MKNCCLYQSGGIKLPKKHSVDRKKEVRVSEVIPLLSEPPLRKWLFDGRSLNRLIDPHEMGEGRAGKN